MSATIYYKNLQRLLYAYADLVEQSNTLGLFDETAAAENLFCEFLNHAFGWNLINANENKNNQDSYDLIDISKGLVIQVTSNKKYSTKLNSTVSALKRSNNPKIKHLIIFFISKKCPANILREIKTDRFIYEGYDLQKLLKKLYFKNKLASQLRILNRVLEEATAPVLINSTFPVIEKVIKEDSLPMQPISIKKSGIFIERAHLIEELFSFGQISNGILVGGAGVGKSFSILELQRLCRKRKVSCFLIRINELLDGTDDELKKELKTSIYWVDALKKVPLVNRDYKAILIFDAFDTAKDEKLKSRILKQIKVALNELKGKWNILVSARTFDAAKSSRLLELFPPLNKLKPLSSRYFEIPELTEQEVILATKSNRKIYSIVQKCTVELRTLLRVPYFLKLLETIVLNSDKSETENLIQLDTEEQLLELFWAKQIYTNTERDIFLRKLTEQIVSNENFSCPKAAIITDLNYKTFDTLVSTGVIWESSVTRQNISFTHNILLEFAISKYCIPEAVYPLFEYIDQNEKTPFFFRQSFIYFYSKLWNQNSDIFWRHYFQIYNNKTPLYRLYHQTILNYVLAAYFKTPNDLNAVFDLENLQERGDFIKKILGALRFINKGAIRDKDFPLLLRISKHIHENFLWELGFIVDKAIKSARGKASGKNLKMISSAALNYLKFVLDERKKVVIKSLIETNGGPWAIQNACGVFYTNSKTFSPQLRRILEILKEPEFPIGFFYSLNEGLVEMLSHDKKLGVLMYETMYNHAETSMKETYMGNSVIMGLRSNRRQDYEMIHYRLEEKFKTLLSMAPEDMIPLGLRISNTFCIGKRYTGAIDKPFDLEVGDIKAKLITDFAFYESPHEKEHGPLSHAENIFRYINQLVLEGATEKAKKLINLFISSSEAGTIWRWLLRFLTNHQKTFKRQIFGLLLNESILLFDETVHEAGELIRAVWAFLSVSERIQVERKILDLSTSNLIEVKSEFTIRRIKRLLNCIPIGELKLKKSKTFVENHGTSSNEPLIKQFGLQPYRPSEEEKVSDIGADSSVETELLAYKLIKLIEPFNNKYDHNNSEKPNKSEYELLIQFVAELFKLCKNQGPFNAKLQFNCDYEVSRFAKLVARRRSGLSKSVRGFIQSIAFYYIEHPSYKDTEFQKGNIKSRAGAYAPTPRTAAAQIFVELLYSDKSGMIRPIIMTLISDYTQIVRFKTLLALGYFWHYQRIEFWSKVLERCALEKDGMCLHQIIDSICYDNMMEANQSEVEKAALILMDSLKDSDEGASDDLWHIYVVLLLKLSIKHDSNIAVDIIYSNLNFNPFARQLIFEIIAVLDPHDIDNDYVTNPRKYDNLTAILAATITSRFNSIKSKGIESDKISEDFEIVDRIVQHLYFSLEHGRKNNKGKEATGANKIAFFKKIKPILNLIINASISIDSGFMAAHTGYYFMQLLNTMLHTDAEYVLSASTTVVKCASANGFTFDQSTLSEVIKLTESIFADHKELLSNKEHFTNLITILDLFANSGWQEALELTWRLKEVF